MGKKKKSNLKKKVEKPVIQTPSVSQQLGCSQPSNKAQK